MHAARCQTDPAGVAVSATGGERAQHSFALGQAAGGGTERDDFPDELVTHHAAVIQATLPPVIDMQVRTTYGAELDPHDRIGRIHQHRIRHRLVPNRPNPVKRQRLHGS